jgi:hypothetical protein
VADSQVYPKPASENGSAKASLSSETGSDDTRRRISQTDVPAASLDDALKVAKAIVENYAGRPTRPLDAAKAMDISPTSSNFRLLTGASIGYGLTVGGPNAPQITVTPLARRILTPTEEGDDLVARREAVLKPRVVRDFLQRYDGSRFPREDIALNVLTQQMGVPQEASKRTLGVIVSGARSVGILQEIKGSTFVNVSAPVAGVSAGLVDEAEYEEQDAEQLDSAVGVVSPPGRALVSPAGPHTIAAPDEKQIKVFISHGKNMDIVEQIKTMLDLADLKYEVAVEAETTAIPVPEKVMSAMRDCTAAVICVTADEHAKRADGTFSLNENVLIEIGAAFVLYDKRVVLVWDRRLPVPSNLQGLYRCEFEGSELSWSTGMRLMKAVANFKRTS